MDSVKEEEEEVEGGCNRGGPLEWDDCTIVVDDTEDRVGDNGEERGGNVGGERIRICSLLSSLILLLLSLLLVVVVVCFADDKDDDEEPVVVVNRSVFTGVTEAEEDKESNEETGDIRESVSLPLLVLRIMHCSSYCRRT